jgi:3-dehydroquinate synthase
MLRSENKKVSRIQVSLGARSYPIYVGRHLLSGCGKFFTAHHLPRQVVIITDATVGPLYAAPLRQSLTGSGYSVQTIALPPGEREKNFRRTDSVISFLLRHKVERNSVIIALGGGVIGDLAGFVAAIYQRGVCFVQIPTTLLAQVDSSIGGKVGVNHPLGKNMIGAFYQPEFVLTDVETIRTLPRREIICGLGEVIKYGIIMDKDFFKFATSSVSALLLKKSSVLEATVKKCCEMKARIVSHDERESGLRAILNFGHTIGHALEQTGHYRSLKHGEAILLGMIAETFIARELGLIPARYAETIFDGIKSVPLPKNIGFRLSPSVLINAMRVDKKVSNRTIRLVLPRKIGSVGLPQPVDEELLRSSVQFLSKFLKN